MAKKVTPDLQARELSQIKSFYEQERMQLAARLHHIDQVIDRLSGGREPIAGPAVKLSAFPEVSAAKAKRVVVESVPVPVKRGPGRPRKNPLVEESKTKKAGRPKKRGPKSIWGNFILRRLRQCDRPLSYGELVRDAMVLNNLPQDKEKNAKQSILNAAFRLRNTLEKIDTVGLPGKKEKFLVMSSWLEAENLLKEPYAKLFKEIAVTPMEDRGRKPRRPSADAQEDSKLKAKVVAKKAVPARKAPVSTDKKVTSKASSTRKKAATAVKKAAPAKTKAAPVSRKTTAKATAKPTVKKTPGRKPKM